MNVAVEGSIMRRGLVHRVLCAAVFYPALWAHGQSFTYQGSLKESGQLADGLYDLEFRLFSTVTRGTAIGTVLAPNTLISDGVFTVELDFGAGSLDGEPRWIEVTVDGQPLSPRQPLSPAPYAHFALDGNGGPWQEVEPFEINFDGLVGINNSSPEAQLDMRGVMYLRSFIDINDYIRLQHETAGLITLQSIGAFLRFTNAIDQPLLHVGPNLGIGTGEPESRVHIFDGDAGLAPSSGSRLTIEDNTHCYINLLAPDAFETAVLFGNPTNGSAAGGVVFNSPGVPNGLQFRTDTNDTQMVITDEGDVGIGTSAPMFQLHLSANSAAKPTSNAWTVSSDARLKKNIQPITHALDDLLALHGVTYQWRDPASQGNMAGTYTGLIAQDVERVFPEWISEDDKGYKTLTVIGFEGIVVEAMRQLRAEKDAEIKALRTESALRIERLEAENAELRARFEELERTMHRLLVNQKGEPR